MNKESVKENVLNSSVSEFVESIAMLSSIQFKFTTKEKLLIQFNSLKAHAVATKQPMPAERSD